MEFVLQEGGVSVWIMMSPGTAPSAARKSREGAANSPPGGAITEIFVVVGAVTAGIARGCSRLGGGVDGRIRLRVGARGNARACLSRHRLAALEGLSPQVVHVVCRWRVCYASSGKCR